MAPFQVAPPLGPFLNRNHFGTWVVLALPLTLGYLMAHASARAARAATASRWLDRARAAMDARSIWLAAAICLMLVALALSVSRAAIAALLAALAVGACLRRGELPRTVTAWAVTAVALGVLAAAVRADPTEIYHRFQNTGSAAAARAGIWRATLPIVRDFRIAGSGAGSFETVMLAYQTTPSLFRINAAHNHYLQVAAEGGAIMIAAVAAALLLFARAAWVALDTDRSPIRLVRIGACAGLIGVALQSVWETGLTTPANAVLAAALAALAVHRSERSARGGD